MPKSTGAATALNTVAVAAMGGHSFLMGSGRTFLDPNATGGTTGTNTGTTTQGGEPTGNQQNTGGSGGESTPGLTPEQQAFADAITRVTEPLTQQVQTLQQQVENLQQNPQGGNRNQPHFSIIQGELPGQAERRGYQLFRAMGHVQGSSALPVEQCKLERDISERLHKEYVEQGGMVQAGNGRTMLIPFGSAEIYSVDSRLSAEVREVMQQGINGASCHQMAWDFRRSGIPNVQQALSAYDDAALGIMLGPTTQGELINLVRARELMARMGATELTLPPNGKISFPRQTGAMTAYWVGESQEITASEPTTGNLSLIAKKLAALAKLPNELIRFGTASVEAFIRMEMATVMGLKASQSMLDGTGGTDSILGLINYANILTHTASTVDTDGNTFEPEDVALMVSLVEEADYDLDMDGFGFAMRPKMWQNLLNRRAAAHTAGTYDGQWLFDVNRAEISNGQPRRLMGYDLQRSTQISNTRTKGSGTDLSYIIGGVWRHWMIARSGVMELATSTQGDTAFTRDQSWIRAIQHLDAAPRYEDAFVVCDQIDMDLPA